MLILDHKCNTIEFNIKTGDPKNPWKQLIKYTTNGATPYEFFKQIALHSQFWPQASSVSTAAQLLLLLPPSTLNLAAAFTALLCLSWLNLFLSSLCHVTTHCA
jgi:hypothetical protein